MRIFQSDQIKIRRLKTTSGNLRAYIATATADASIQPLSGRGGGKDRLSLDVGVFGNLYVAYVEDSIDIRVDDKVSSRDGTLYQVTEVIMRDFGAFPYKEAILKKS